MTWLIFLYSELKIAAFFLFLSLGRYGLEEALEPRLQVWSKRRDTGLLEGARVFGRSLTAEEYRYAGPAGKIRQRVFQQLLTWRRFRG
jgi:hypothetical protein